MARFVAMAVLSASLCFFHVLASACPETWSFSDSAAWRCTAVGHQSPVNIQTAHMKQVPMDSWLLSFWPGDKTGGVNYTFDGRMWQVGYTGATAGVQAPGAQVLVPLSTIDFHAPSEHTLNGEHTEMEMQIVNYNPYQDIYVVISFLLRQGNDDTKAHAYLETLWNNFPTEIGKRVGTAPDPYLALFPGSPPLILPNKSYYYYSGSLTAPPCKKTSWYVMKDALQVTPEQVSQFRKAINRPKCDQLVVSGRPEGVSEDWSTSLGNNNRPVQPLGNRTVVLINATMTINTDPKGGSGFVVQGFVISMFAAVFFALSQGIIGPQTAVAPADDHEHGA